MHTHFCVSCLGIQHCVILNRWYDKPQNYSAFIFLSLLVLNFDSIYKSKIMLPLLFHHITTKQINHTFYDYALIQYKRFYS